MNLDEIEAEFNRLVACLPVEDEWAKFNRKPTHTGCPHVEQHGGLYHYVTTERGSESERKVTPDPDELLFWLLEVPAFTVAISYEMKHRIPGVDGRRMLFPITEELMESMRAGWGDRKRKQHAEILSGHPFRDV